MRFLIIFIFLITNSFANESPNIKNLIINKEPIKYNGLRFLDIEDKPIILDDYLGNLIILNFWATWCAPCKEEMPSLNQLMSNSILDNLKIFPINVGNDNSVKSQKFFKDLEITNLEPFFVSSMVLAKKLSLRGIPTSILINKDGEEFARVVGSIDFVDKKFIEWLKSYN